MLNKKSSSIFSLNQAPEKKKSTKKRLLIGLAVVLLVTGIVAVLHVTNIITLPFLSNNSNESKDKGINYGPPTEEEKKAGDETKSTDQSKPLTATPSANIPTKQPVTPIIVTVGQEDDTKNVTARGLIPGIFESGGTCTLTLTKGGQSVSGSNPAVVDAQSITCGQLEVDRSKLSSGTWSAVISYSSGTYEGKSSEAKVEVQ